MFAIIPSNWKFDLKGLAEVWRRSDDSLENHEMVRSNLLKGERLFLIGTEGVSDSDRYIVAVDHIALFGSSPLTGNTCRAQAVWFRDSGFRGNRRSRNCRTRRSESCASGQKSWMGVDQYGTPAGSGTGIRSIEPVQP